MVMTSSAPRITSRASTSPTRGRVHVRQPLSPYLPAVLTGMVVIYLWKLFFNPSDAGFLNMLIMKLGIGKQGWLSDAKLAMMRDTNDMGGNGAGRAACSGSHCPRTQHHTGTVATDGPTGDGDAHFSSSRHDRAGKYPRARTGTRTRRNGGTVDSTYTHNLSGCAKNQPPFHSV